MSAWLWSVRCALWGPFTIVFLLLTGAVLSVVTGVVQLRCFPGFLRTLRDSRKKRDGISPLGALCTSLGGTLGIGNLAGVGTAIMLGGAGAVLYMLLAAFLGMATKYAEIVLAVRFRTRQDGKLLGGPMLYLSQGAQKPMLAALFGVLCIVSSLLTGGMAQAGAVCEAVQGTLPLPPLLIGGVLALLAAPTLCGGGRRIAHMATVLVPLMTLLYLVGCALVLFYCRASLVLALRQIWEQACSTLAAGGGLLGFAQSRMIVSGFSKGIFSNEAGMGTAPIAHGCADSRSAEEQGLLGAVEVFLDTCVMCLMTALVILVTGVPLTGANGLVLTTDAFACVFGLPLSRLFLGVMVCLLAFSTVLSQSFYGLACLRFFGRGQRARRCYLAALLVCVALGGLLPLSSMLLVCDICAALLVFPNLIGLWTLLPVLRDEERKRRRRG